MSTLRYISFDIRRALKEPTALAVSIALPSVLFIVFGASQTGTDRAFNDGNVAAYVMIGMAAYGAITGAVGTVGNMVIDEISGWGRQLALTPLRAWQRTVAQIVTTMARAALAVIGVFLCGYFGSASMPIREWLAAGALSVVAVIPFSLYGLVFASAFRSSAAVSLASLSIVPLAFVGNAFAPHAGVIHAVRQVLPHLRQRFTRPLSPLRRHPGHKQRPLHGERSPVVRAGEPPRVDAHLGARLHPPLAARQRPLRLVVLMNQMLL